MKNFLAILFSLITALQGQGKLEKDRKLVSRVITPELRAAVASLKMPGVSINLDEWAVDLDAKITLKQGFLELVACTANSKEHESIVAVTGKPSFAHAALLLLGAQPGKPAVIEIVGEKEKVLRKIPAFGALVDVFLVILGKDGKPAEKPIHEFIVRADEPGADGVPKIREPREFFPDHSFLFSGSVMDTEGEGPARYLSDVNGNVISIASFGDELLCRPEITGHENETLEWAVNGEKLPELDQKVILRLRPRPTN